MTDQRKKLLYIVRPAVGGMRKHLVDLVSSLDRSAYEISIATPQDQVMQKKLGGIANFTTVDIADRLSFFRDLRSIISLRKIIKNTKPDLIHIHGSKSALLGRIAAFNFRFPVIVTFHNFPSYLSSSSFKRKLSALVERLLSRRTAKIVAVSGQLKASLVKDLDLDPEHIIVIYNGIDPCELRSSDKKTKGRLGFGEGDFVLLNIGRLVDFKGQRYLIGAFSLLSSKYPQLKLLIVGSGPLEKKLKDLVDELNLQAKIKFIAGDEDVSPIYALADLLVFPSINETFGLVLLEAMAARLPIVASASGGVVEILENRKSALLVEPADALALAKAIEELYGDEVLRRSLAEAARDTLHEKFTLKRMVRETENLYAEILNARIASPVGDPGGRGK